MTQSKTVFASCLVVLLSLGVGCRKKAAKPPKPPSPKPTGKAVKPPVTPPMRGFPIRIFSTEFYSDETVLYTMRVPFSNVALNGGLALPVGRKHGDDKTDIAIICRSSLNEPWILSLLVSPGTGLQLRNICARVDSAWNRNGRRPAEGEAVHGTREYRMVTQGETVLYSSGRSDRDNCPLGTLIRGSFAVNGTGLQRGRSYHADIEFRVTSSSGAVSALKSVLSITTAPEP